MESYLKKLTLTFMIQALLTLLCLTAINGHAMEVISNGRSHYTCVKQYPDSRIVRKCLNLENGLRTRIIAKLLKTLQGQVCKTVKQNFLDMCTPDGEYMDSEDPWLQTLLGSEISNEGCQEGCQKENPFKVCRFLGGYSTNPAVGDCNLTKKIYRDKICLEAKVEGTCDMNIAFRLKAPGKFVGVNP